MTDTPEQLLDQLGKVDLDIKCHSLNSAPQRYGLLSRRKVTSENMDTTQTLLADKLPDILNRTFFLLIDQEEYGTSLSSWRKYRMKQGNAKKETEGESLCRVQGLCERTEFFYSLQTNHTKPGQKPTTQMSVYHGPKSVAKSSVQGHTKPLQKSANSRQHTLRSQCFGHYKQCMDLTATTIRSLLTAVWRGAPNGHLLIENKACRRMRNGKLPKPRWLIKSLQRHK